MSELEDVRAAKAEKDQICDEIEISRKELVGTERRNDPVNILHSFVLSDSSVQRIIVYSCGLVTGERK